jgi:hypothetical protein
MQFRNVITARDLERAEDARSLLVLPGENQHKVHPHQPVLRILGSLDVITATTLNREMETVPASSLWRAAR